MVICNGQGTSFTGLLCVLAWMGRAIACKTLRVRQQTFCLRFRKWICALGDKNGQGGPNRAQGKFESICLHKASDPKMLRYSKRCHLMMDWKDSQWKHTSPVWPCVNCLWVGAKIIRQPIDYWLFWLLTITLEVCLHMTYTSSSQQTMRNNLKSKTWFLSEMLNINKTM